MINIYIVDDEIMAVQYLEYLLKETGREYYIQGTATNSTKALYDIQKFKPDIIFTDISMPIMDGLELADRILKKMKTRFYLLTSYEDFEYAKRGVKIGVTDYILKNELNEKMLQDLLKDAEAEIEENRKKEHLIMEHNIRDFLINTTEGPEDHAYEEKPFQRYALLTFYRSSMICMKSIGKESEKSLNCYKIQGMVFPEGIRCSAFAEIENNLYCAIIFIDSTVNDSMRVLYKVSDTILSEIEQTSRGWKCLQSDALKHFFELQAAYHKADELKDYLYAHMKKSIFGYGDFINAGQKEIETQEYLEDISNLLNTEMHEQAVTKIREFFEICRANLKQLQYAENMQNLYYNVRRVTFRKNLNPDNLIMANAYSDPEKLERALLNCVELFFEDLEKSKGHNYSEHVYRAIEYIRKNYARDISVSEISDSIQISEGHLRRLFKQEMNTSVIDYLTDYRLERVKSMMKDRSVSLTDIWQKTGFSSAQYFSFVFKKKENMMPKDYLKKQRETD